MTIWAFVPARGGSKSIPLKNLVPVAGVPLLNYGVRAVQASGRISRIICSTDHDDIAVCARELGIEVDCRPRHLATDDAAVADVAREFLARKGSPDILVLVQPTSPFLLPEHVQALLSGWQRRRFGCWCRRCISCARRTRSRRRPISRSYRRSGQT